MGAGSSASSRLCGSSDFLFRAKLRAVPRLPLLQRLRVSATKVRAPNSLNAFVSIIGATSIIFPYLGEFFSVKHRDNVLGRLEIFWNIGMIVLPGLAWIILGHPLKNAVNFNSWRLFVLVCGLPSLCSILLLCLLPETPKYLIARSRFEHAKDVFRRIFVCNTRKEADEYPVSCAKIVDWSSERNISGGTFGR